MSEVTKSTSGTGCPDLEDLAALADGRLRGAERERVVAHLADCERCYEIFAEVVELQEEEEDGAREAPANPPGDGAEPLAEVVVHPRSRSWWPAAGAAAAAALVLLVAAPLLFDGRQPTPDAGWDEHDWLRLRSVPALSPEARAFRLGVRSVDLVVALEAGRADRAKEHGSSLRALAGGIEHYAGARELLEKLSARLRDGEEPAGLVRQAERAAELLLDVVSPPPYYELGRWAEAGREAALVGDSRFFTSAGTRRFLDHLKSFEASPEIPGALPAELAGELKSVRSLIAAEPAGEQLEDLERALTRVVDLAGYH